ncbi:rCG25582 [Rattus norvegicus]
MEFAE